MSQNVPQGAMDIASNGADVTVRIVGDLDRAAAPDLAAVTLPVLEREAGLAMTVDLDGVKFCDSAGMSALIKLRQRCAERGWSFRAINAHPSVYRVLAIYAGLGGYLNLQPRPGHRDPDHPGRADPVTR